MPKDLKKKLLALLPQPAVYEPSEIVHATESLKAKDLEQAEHTLRLGIVFNLVLLICVPILGPANLRAYIMSAAVLCGGIDVLWVLVLHKQRFIRAKHITVVFNLVLISAFAWTMRAAAAAGDTPNYVTLTNAHVTMSAFLIILSPFSDYLTPLKALGFFAVTAAIFPHRPETVEWLVTYGVGLGFAVVVQRMQTERMRREIVLEYRSRQAEIRAASMRFQRDLELAREIQDSMAPPAHSIMPGGEQVYCVQLKYEKIAGDWMTVRRFSDGSLVMVVVDATGKGMQAALVVHAIQSLWATTMDDECFDPEKWLLLVNQALNRLGEKQTHSATSGIAVLKGNRLTYWSAGHLPLFLLLGPARAAMLKSLNGKGNILGIGSVLQLTPQYIDFSPTLPVRIVLASDGVLEKGTLTHQKDVEALYAGMKRDGAQYLDGLPSNDDKTLIMVERKFEYQPVAEAS